MVEEVLNFHLYINILYLQKQNENPFLAQDLINESKSDSANEE